MEPPIQTGPRELTQSKLTGLCRNSVSPVIRSHTVFELPFVRKFIASLEFWWLIDRAGEFNPNLTRQAVNVVKMAH